MVSVYDLKPRFQALLRPLCLSLAGRGITANQVTVAAFVLSLLHGLWIASGVWTMLALLTLPVTLFLRMALNAIDGMLAREFNQKSRLGALLNELGDIAADAALYLPLIWVAGMPQVLLASVVILGLLVEVAAILGPMIGASRRYDGPFGKSDRALFFSLFAVLVATGVLQGPLITAALALGLLLGAACLAQRMRRALAEAPGDTP
ncbi:CDP-alcohol phosphatidyltransferase family protein [Oceanibium sediminis]|uniref:CDP-alcohol phosphatidyltransferase family protein n=1 Tax=Oceanibium sediminis TaxID=2026339 RepID=UPI000DD3856F|nr:CDP-alcohol phosphatidyltransferase family protein [Oceanibium sediminis]